MRIVNNKKPQLTYYKLMSNNFRENLKDELEYQDITIKELSLKTEISNRSIENYLSKRESIPPADYAVKIAKALGVTVEYLVTGRNPDCTTPDKTQQISRMLHKCTEDQKSAVLSLLQAFAAK